MKKPEYIFAVLYSRGHTNDADYYMRFNSRDDFEAYQEHKLVKLDKIQELGYNPRIAKSRWNVEFVDFESCERVGESYVKGSFDYCWAHKNS